MSRAVKLSDETIKSAQIRARVDHRSLAKQIEHWAKIGKIAEENPELNYAFIQEILLGIEEMKAGEVKPYIFGTET